MTVGSSNKPLSEKLAERQKDQLGKVENLTQEQLNEHVIALKQQLNTARDTTESAIRDQTERLTSALSEAETRQRGQIEGIESRLATAAAQAEKLSRIGGIRSWMRPAAITVSVMLAVGGVTVGGLAVADRVIDSRIERLTEINEEINRAKEQPRLPAGVEIRSLSDGQSYLIGVDPKRAWVGTLNDGQTPVIGLTREKD